MSDFINLICYNFKQHYDQNELENYPLDNHTYTADYLNYIKYNRIKIINDLLVRDRKNNWFAFKDYAHLVPCTKIDFFEFIESEEDESKTLQWKNNIVDLLDLE